MLNKQVLINGIRGLCDEGYSGFSNFPTTFNEAVTRWGQIMHNYAGPVTPPSTTQQPARSAFEATLSTMQVTNDFNILGHAVREYALAIGPGQTGFTSTVQSTPPDFTQLILFGVSGGSAYDCANRIATIIDDWMRKNFSTNINTGVVVYWS